MDTVFKIRKTRMTDASQTILSDITLAVREEVSDSLTPDVNPILKSTMNTTNGICGVFSISRAMI